jgi:Tol biopolymer transport system component
LGVAAGKVYVVPSSGGVPKEISTDLAIAGAPVWSPDGKYLLVFGEKTLDQHFGESPDWWVLPASGGTATQTGAYASFASQDIGLTKLDTMAYPSDWVGDKILFSGKAGDAVDVWQVAIHSGPWRIKDKAQRLTSIAGRAVSSSLTSDGRILFSNLSQQTHLWMLPMDTCRGIAKSAPRQLTDSAAAEYWPSVSEDGRRLAFTSTRNGKEDIWLKDLHTGVETRIPPMGDRQEFPTLSHDGRKLAFTAVEGQGEMQQQRASIYILSLDTMQAQKVLEKGDWVWTWSPDDRYLICKWGALRRFRFLDPASGRMTEFLQGTRHVFQATFSRDGRWLAFMDMSGIIVGPYRGLNPISKRDWIHVTHGDYFDDKPRWSPDGSRIYFTSDRDGSRCLWMQRLDRETKSPVGVPVPVYHFHFGRRSIANVGAGLADIAIVADGVILPQTELKGNVWLATIRK